MLRGIRPSCFEGKVGRKGGVFGFDVYIHPRGGEEKTQIPHPQSFLDDWMVLFRFEGGHCVRERIERKKCAFLSLPVGRLLLGWLWSVECE